MRLKDKVAIVTGASSEIGAKYCKRFAEEGANVVFIRKKVRMRLEKTQDQILKIKMLQFQSHVILQMKHKFSNSRTNH